jgi:hypothetical protein
MDNTQGQPPIMTRIFELYEQIESLAIKQVDLLASNQLMEEVISPLVDLTNQRQQCMNDIDKLVGSLEEEPPAAARAAMAAVIQRILNLDKDSQLKLQDIVEATSSKLIKVQDMKKANRAYGGQDEPTEAWFFDRKR